MTRDHFFSEKTEKIVRKSGPQFSLVEERLTMTSEIETKRNIVNGDDHWVEAFRVVMIVLLQSIPEEMSSPGNPKVKTATLPSCEEDVSSKKIKKPEGSEATLLNCYFNNF